MEVVSGIRRPEAGVVRVKGADPYGRPDGLGLGIVRQEGGLFPGLTVAEIVDTWCRWTLDSLTRGDVLRLTVWGFNIRILALAWGSVSLQTW
ncbi:hypothetical protein J4709_11205 [Actinomadura sp. LCR2-06]|uniref:Uncharacterized protein n=2 Tax=Actinomadura violacea TaxID=2819934 RepID=A0ABS3RPZ2_9ACTN|nr:hypothetical protein [Actinomadura violacea]MBO2458140.1 hypothetical protein [Actinomadura violacea]